MGQLALVQQRTSKTQMLLNSGLTSMTTSMLLSLQTRYLIIWFLYVNQNCIDCLIKEIGIGNSIDNPTYIPMILTKVEIQDNHLSVLYSFGISNKDEERIYRHCTGYLICTSIHTNRTISLILSNVTPNIFPIY